MSGFVSRLPLIGLFNGAGSAGPRRLLIIAGGAAALTAVIFSASSIRHKELPRSSAGLLPSVDPLPAGLHSNPQQDKLHLVSNQEQADLAQKSGRSFTPVMVASQPYTPPQVVTPRVVKPDVAPAVQAYPVLKPITVALSETLPTVTAVPAVVARQPTAIVSQAVMTPAVITPAATTPAPPTRTPKEEADFKVALDKLMGGWGTRPPRTDVVLPPDEAAAAEAAGNQSGAGQVLRRRVAASDDRSISDAVSAAPSSNQASRQRILVPAGRGIYAHTILAANSDQQSPIILQADSGPISGDRMIGTFGRERDRLVIRISKVIHNGQEIGTDGVVVAPGTMEVGVASSVDQNYLSRFALPAAAAFVQGLGQAIAQSNSTSVLGPLGSVAVQNRLNFEQQAGIGAGVAAAQIGSALQQSAPKGPTVILDVGASVGVLFLANVSATP